MTEAAPLRGRLRSGSLRSPPLRRPRRGARRSEEEQFTERRLHQLQAMHLAFTALAWPVRSRLDKSARLRKTAAPMAANADAPLDQLWKEYSQGFRDFDDLRLARWLTQTLGQLAGKTWRLSHPLLGAYRLAAQLAHERQIWLQRLVTPPPAYSESACCRAPMLPLLTRDVHEAGLLCQHCNETLVPFEDIPAVLQGELEAWAAEYGPVHAVAQ